MKTSTQIAADALHNALSNPAYKVIALTGKWGTGKTHLWQTLNLDKKEVLEISAFGAKSIEDIKRKLFQDSVKISSTKTKDFATSALKALEVIPKKFFGLSISDLALTVLPQMVEGKTIVIDDIERKNKSLEISEILGLIDEYTQKYKSKFLLILNTDSMEDKQLWQGLHEKIIDKEIVLNPSSKCSFEIAAKDLDNPMIAIAEKVFEEYKIQNIRVIRKALQAVNEILSNQNSLPEVLYKNYVPTLIFLAICHYRGFSNGLTLDYVANNIFKQPNDPEVEAFNAMIKKSSLRADKLSELTIDYLRLGVVRHEDVAFFFNPLKASAEDIEFKNRFNTFVDELYWSLEQTKDDVQSRLQSLIGRIYELDANQISSLFNALELNGYSEEAEGALSAWLEKAKDDQNAYQKLEYIYAGRAPEKLWEFKTKLSPPEEVVVSLKEILQNFRLNNRITQKAINTLSSSTQADYEETLKSLPSAELKDFIELHFRFGEGRDDYLRSAQKSFIAACKSISTTAPETRLGNILHRELHSREI